VSRVPTEPPAWVLDQRRAVGARAREIRVSKQVSQERLAELAGLDRKTVNRLEVGSFNVGVDAFLLVARALDVPPSALFPDE
jgi:transcriptional regulator with XRE-family HTH domain